MMMVATPVVRREPAHVTHRAGSRPAAAPPEGANAPAASSSAAGQSEPSIDERIHTEVDAALAEALAKVSTPADAEVAAQQQAFDQMLQQRTEATREMNAIREMGLEQAKHEDEFMKEWIKLI